MLPDKIMQTKPTVARRACSARVRLGVSGQKIQRWARVGTISPSGIEPICVYVGGVGMGCVYVWLSRTIGRPANRASALHSSKNALPCQSG